ncbi:MAG: Uma2 family endonuclease [Cyanobacteria bacterium P01_C01_bin.89]
MVSDTVQFRWLVMIKQNLERLQLDSPLFVAGDLFWYPVEGRPDIRVSPDVMVAVGRPAGDRGSYLQWQEENVAPQVVFEILSPGNTLREMGNKLLFYNNYGVEEYYVFDPAKNILDGWQRTELGFDSIAEINGWTSPQLGIVFDLSGDELVLKMPDGKPFETYQELMERAKVAEEAAQVSTERAAAAERALEEERSRSEKLAEQLKALGIDPEA